MDSHTVPDEQEASWLTIPNEIRAVVVGKLDVESRTALERCSREDLKTVRSFAKKQRVDVRAEHIGKGMNIEMKYENTNDIIYTWAIRTYQKKHSRVLQKNSQGVRIYSKILKMKPYSKVANKIIGKLASVYCRMFQVCTLELELNEFQGTIKFSEPVYPSTLVLKNCWRKSIFTPILCNFSFGWDTMHVRFDERDRDYERTLKIPRRLTTNKVWLISSFLDVEKSFKKAFPVDCKIESFEDASNRYMMFLSGSTRLKQMLELEHVKREITTEWFINMLMYIRAAFTSDPVDYLKENMEKYEEKVNMLHEVHGTVTKYQLLPFFSGALTTVPGFRCKSEDDSYRIPAVYLSDMKLVCYMKIGKSCDNIEFKTINLKIDHLVRLSKLENTGFNCDLESLET